MAKLDIPNQTLTLSKGNQLDLEGPPKCTSLLKTCQTVEVPPYAEAIFPVKVKDKQTKGQMLVEPLVSTWNKLHLMVAHVLKANEPSKRVCRVLNPIIPRHIAVSKGSFYQLCCN